MLTRTTTLLVGGILRWGLLCFSPFLHPPLSAPLQVELRPESPEGRDHKDAHGEPVQNPVSDPATLYPQEAR